MEGSPQLTNSLAIGGGAVQGGLSLFSAFSQNRAIQDSINAAAEEAAFTQEGIALQAGARLAENQSRMAQVRGRVRVQSQEGEGGQALIRQAAIDAKTNEAVIRINQGIATTAVRRGFQAAASNLSSQAVNPFLAAITGAIGGASTGLQLGGGFEDMTASRRALDQIRGSGVGEVGTPPFLPPFPSAPEVLF